MPRQNHRNTRNQIPSAPYYRRPRHDQYSFRAANPYQWVPNYSQNDGRYHRNMGYHMTQNNLGYNQSNQSLDYPQTQQLHNFMYQNEYSEFESVNFDSDEYLNSPKTEKIIPKADKSHSKPIDEALHETIDTVKRKLQERRISDCVQDGGNIMSPDSSDCIPPATKIVEKKRIEHSKMSPKACLEKKCSKKDELASRVKNMSSHELPKLNNKEKSERIRKNILQQLFKLDNHNLRQILSEPESSAKYNFALTTLLKDTRKMLSKQLRTVAEKSLKFHNVSANTAQGEKIVRDAFLGHLETMLDPNATIELFSMEPQIINELSKVLQEDLMNSGNEDLSIQNLAETIQKNFLCDMEEENINMNDNLSQDAPFTNIKFETEKSLFLENSCLQEEIQVPNSNVQSSPEILVDRKSDIFLNSNEMQKFNISVVKLSSLMENEKNALSTLTPNQSENIDNSNLPESLPIVNCALLKTSEVNSLNISACNEVLKFSNSEKMINSNLSNCVIENHNNQNLNWGPILMPSAPIKKESRYTQYEQCSKSDAFTQTNISNKSVQSSSDPKYSGCSETDTMCAFDDGSCDKFDQNSILDRMKKIDEKIHNLLQEKFKLYNLMDSAKTPQDNHSFQMNNLNKNIELNNGRRKKKLRTKHKIQSNELQEKETNLLVDEKITINKFYSVNTNGKLTVHNNMKNIELPSINSLKKNGFHNDSWNANISQNSGFTPLKKGNSNEVNNMTENLAKKRLNPRVILHDCFSISQENPSKNNSDGNLSKISIRIDHTSLKPTLLLDQKESILAIKNVGSNLLAASEYGNLYNLCIKNGRLKNTIECSKEAITSLHVLNNTNTVYIGSLDSHLYCYDFESGISLFSPIDVNGPIQSMCHAWNTLFIGTRSGNVVQYNTTEKKIKRNMNFATQSILDLKAIKEGPRKVLVIASRSPNVEIKDANSGLILRTLEGLSKTVYSILFHGGQLFCGTNDSDIEVFDFVTGKLKGYHTAGKGVVCLQIYNGVLFAGCYDGIYIFKLGVQNPIICIQGPGKMLLAMAIDKEMITGAYKDKSLYIWRIPKELLSKIGLEDYSAV